jgi:hypothetical protein
MATALSTTCWGILNTDTMAAFAYRMRVRTPPPNIPKPELRDDSHDWKPYPKDGGSRPGYYNELLRYRCDLSLLVLVDHADISTYRSEISDLCVFFRAMSRRFPWVFPAFRMFQVSTKQLGKRLAPETEKLFEEFETLD